MLLKDGHNSGNGMYSIDVYIFSSMSLFHTAFGVVTNFPLSKGTFFPRNISNSNQSCFISSMLGKAPQQTLFKINGKILDLMIEETDIHSK